MYEITTTKKLDWDVTKSGQKLKKVAEHTLGRAVTKRKLDKATRMKQIFPQAQSEIGSE